MRNFVFRFSFFSYVTGNFIYILLLYFLWQAIYRAADSEVLNGMTFSDTYLYLCFANILYVNFSTALEWWMAGEVRSGDIAMTLLKPMDWQLRLLFTHLGFLLFNFIMLTLPSLIFISLVVRPGLRLGLNLIFFLPSFFMAYGITFLFDFFIGLITFYTESFFGFSLIKQYLVRLLSGSLIPLAFFPGVLKTIIQYLPFKAIYEVPVRLLMDRSMQLPDFLGALGFQAAWLVVLMILGRLSYNRSIRYLIINGG